jgi:hypothetical protein
MPAAFFDYVRGRSEQPPAGYELRGLRVYRHLVWLGASQMVDASFPGLREQLGEPAWRELIADFVRQSQWTSPFYADLEHEFNTYLARAAA